MREESLPFSQYSEFAQLGASVKTFRKEASIFAGYVEDGPKVMDRCYEYDKMFWKV